jgi:pyruvate,water dikinase
VAREYGVPAVVNVNRATQYIHDGQTITVDGTSVQVYLEARQAMEETNLERQ